MSGKLRGKLLPYQYKMIYTKALFPALVCGFGSGKSDCLVRKVMKQVFEIKDAKIGVYEPTIELVHKIIIPKFIKILEDTKLVYTYRKNDRIIEIKNIGNIYFFSLENPERIIGYDLHHAHIDELDTLDERKASDCWDKILARLRTKIEARRLGADIQYKNTCSVYTTPEGYRFVYKNWEKNRKKDILDTGISDYDLIQGSTYQNIFLPPSYITNLEKNYPKNLIQAYLNGQFVNLEQGQVYVAFDNILNITDKVVYNNNCTLYVGIDFNVGHMSAVVCIKEKDKAYVVDEITDIRDTPMMIDEIKSRYDGHNIRVYPDASGNSRKTVDASKSDISLLKEAGFTPVFPRKNPPIKDRILAVNTMFCNSLGERRLFINPNTCSNLVDNLNEQAYDEHGNPVKSHNVDHIIDALGYVIHKEFAINKPRTSITRFTVF